MHGRVGKLWSSWNFVSAETKALTLFVRDNRLKVYNEPGPYGSTLAELDLNNGQQTRSNSKLAYYPDYPNGATTYYFNLGDMIAGLDRKDACTLFESESDYPRINPVRSVGADGLGNHIGRSVFNKETYTFWITYDQSKYVLPHSGSYDWEAQIVCVMK